VNKKAESTLRRLCLARTIGVLGTLLAVTAGAACGQMKKAASSDRVDLGLMTAYEVRDALASGKTTALVYNGGTETRGPADVNGGHTLIAQERDKTAPPDPAKPMNGVSGDGRRSSAELGKYGADPNVNDAVAQIRQLLGTATANNLSVKTGSIGR
jgi:hypothetical protein